MADKEASTETKQELSDLLAWERQSITRQFRNFRSRMSPKAQLERFIEKHPAIPIGAAVVGGLILVKILLPNRSSQNHDADHDNAAVTTVKQTGKIGIMLGGLVALARPAIQDFLIAQTKKELNRRFSGGNTPSSDLTVDIPAERRANSSTT